MALAYDFRFVQLVDGRKILQVRFEGESRVGDWETPPTVDVRTLPDDERADIADSLKT